MAEVTKKYAVVTGSNKGIGLEICRLLASQGITVVLTARDEKRGLEAVEKLKGSGLSGGVIFHQLDVADPASVASFAEFIKSRFGKLDILVNNAAILGVMLNNSDAEKSAAGVLNSDWARVTIQTHDLAWARVTIQTHDLSVECLQINYYGAKRITEQLLPILQLSESPRIVNVSSSMGQLKNIPNEWAKVVLKNVENLTEERIDEVLNLFFKDFKEGSPETKGWPDYSFAYIVSKAAMNAYTRLLAKKVPGVGAQDLVGCVPIDEPKTCKLS